MASLFGITFSRPSAVTSPVPALWPMSLVSKLYTEIFMRMIYSRILMDVLARSHKISDTFRPLLLNSCEGLGQKGLVGYIVESMVRQDVLVLKYEANILAVPEYKEREAILTELKDGKQRERVLVLSFKDYHRSTVLRQYLEHKYLLLCTQNKALNLSAAVQIKIDNLRQSVALNDGDPAEEQARKIAEALLEGRPALLDSKDVIELLSPDTGPLKEVSADLHAEISFILGLPLSWITGVQKVGLGDTGDADARAIERGLEPYFWESVYPAFQKLFGVSLTFQTDDYRNITPGLEALKTFELTGDGLMAWEEKRKVVADLLGLDEKAIEKPEQEEPLPTERPPRQIADEPQAD